MTKTMPLECERVNQVDSYLVQDLFVYPFADYEHYGELSKAVLLLQEQGVLDQIQTRWWKQKKGGGACTVYPIFYRSATAFFAWLTVVVHFSEKRREPTRRIGACEYERCLHRLIVWLYSRFYIRMHRKNGNHFQRGQTTWRMYCSFMHIQV